jgi:hypothetical protein
MKQHGALLEAAAEQGSPQSSDSALHEANSA